MIRPPTLVLRLSALGLLVFVLLAPSAERRVRLKDVPVAVVVDSSESMAAADGPGGKAGRPVRRWEAVMDLLRGERGALEENFAPIYFTLHRKLEPVPWKDLEKKTPNGDASDISLLGEIPRRHPEARAVLLFTDGRAGGGRDPFAAAARLGLPVFGVGAGEGGASPDLLVDSLQAPRFAFKNADVEITVRVLCRHFSPGVVTVALSQGEQTVASQRVEVSSAPEGVPVTLTFRPRATGLQTYQVRLPAYRAESNVRNNSRSFSLDVSRDRLRVLYICGKPGPNYAFLRHQLKTNPLVELVTFVILRDPDDAVPVPDQQLSLIPFPAQETLFEQLRTFDLVILEQFSFAPFGIGPAGLAAVRDFVERGGGLLLMGGADVLGPGGPYRGSALEPLIPLSLDGAPRPGPARFSLEVPAVGHPVTALAEEAEDSSAAWKRLPVLEGSGWFLPAVKPGAALLAGAASPEGTLPVLAAWQRGRGRVMAFLSTTSWRWALAEAGAGRGGWAYQRFWNNTLRWLSGSEDYRLVRLEVPAEAASVGEEALLRVFVQDEHHRPLDAAEVRLTVTGPDGETRRRTLRPLEKGEYTDSVPVDAAGTYRASVQAFHRQRKLGEDERAFRAGFLWDERNDTSTDFPALERLAVSSGGEFVPLEDFSMDWLEGRLGSAAWTSERRRALWDAPWVLAALVALLLAEWTLRRRRGDL